MKTLKIKSSPLSEEFREKRKMTKRKFDKKFDQDLAVITEKINKEVEGRRCGTIPLDG
jgi:hypothetical protein